MERYQKQHYALGSDVFLTIVTSAKASTAQKILDDLYKHITAFEKQFSRFLPTSELTAFNASAGNKTKITPSFLKLLISTKELAEKSEGLFNPFILPALQRAGYLGSWPKPEKKKKTTDFTQSKVVPIRELIIGNTWAQIPKHTALDFGGIGKGYLLDELAEKLDNEQLAGYWLSLGGDILCSGYDIDGQNWSIGVASTVLSEPIVDTISNSDGGKLAIATSGTTKRRGVKNGKTWHHLIDPRTGESAKTNILTATVCAERATEADVLAKCVVVEGAEKAQLYKDQDLIQSYILQTLGVHGIVEVERG